MKTIIAGSRAIRDYGVVARAIQESGFEITEVVSGGAQGVDSLGEVWANGNHVPVKRFPAKWKRYGSKAGPIRNQQMADYADALVAVWNGKSSGTRDMIKKARKCGLKVFVYRVCQPRGRDLRENQVPYGVRLAA